MRLKLREYRRRLKLTGEEVAHRLGITQPTVTRHEQNPASVSVKRLADYAEIYGCAPADLLGDSRDDSVPDHALLRLILESVVATLKREEIELTGPELGDVVAYLIDAIIKVPGKDRAGHLEAILADLLRYTKSHTRPVT